MAACRFFIPSNFSSGKSAYIWLSLIGQIIQLVPYKYQQSQPLKTLFDARKLITGTNCSVWNESLKCVLTKMNPIRLFLINNIAQTFLNDGVKLSLSGKSRKIQNWMSQIVRNGLKAVENEKVSFLGRRKHFLNSIFSDGESFERIDRSRILVFVGGGSGGRGSSSSSGGGSCRVFLRRKWRESFFEWNPKSEVWTFFFN